MNRRYFLLALLACLGFAGAPFAQDEPEGALVKSPAIIDALSKDIVLDRNGPPGRRSAQARPNPSINLYVQFGFDSAEILPRGQRQLDELAQALRYREFAANGFHLAGHTDLIGDDQYNMRLSLARAEAVKGYLVQVHGIAPQRLLTVGFGSRQPLDARNPAAPINRRVEVSRVRLSQPAPAYVPPAPAPLYPPAQPANDFGGRLVPTPR